MTVKYPPIIIGAGLAGLLAAHAWPQTQLFERSPEPRAGHRAGHRALLRFRSDSVSRLTGIEFRPVLVRKGIWYNGAAHSPRIELANMYALKVLGLLTGERSIWNLEAVTRYVAPDSFYEQLLGAVSGRVTWGTTMDRQTSIGYNPIISTAPLPETLLNFGITNDNKLSFDRAAITVKRIELPAHVDLYQTIYFPGRETSLYRASITGSTLIAEFVGEGPVQCQEEWIEEIWSAFGLGDLRHAGVKESVQQKYGKIAPVDNDGARKQLLFRLTQERNVYSLGRFATWRNILLDDVVDDIAMIKRLMRSNAPAYDLRRADSAAR